MASRPSDGFHLTLKGNSLQTSAHLTSRPSSARSNSQTRPAPTTRTASARDQRISSARQRRHSNNGAKPAWLPSENKGNASSAHDDVDVFFTDQTHWDDTKQWIEQLQPYQSRNGDLLQSTHNRRGNELSASQMAGIAQATPMEIDLRRKMATITIQRWYRKVRMRRRMAEAALKRVLEQKKIEHQASMERTKELEKLALLEQKKNREEKQRQTRLMIIKETQQRRKASVESPMKIDEVRPLSSRRSSQTSMKPIEKVPETSNTSKVTLNDVYETLRKLEEVEQFPIQTPLEDDSMYLVESARSTSTVQETPSRVESILSYLDEATRVEPIRSEKSTARDPPTVRHPTPPTSTRTQQKKVAQSVALPQTKSNGKVSVRTTKEEEEEKETKGNASHKSMMVHSTPSEPIDREAEQTAKDVTETVLQLRMETEEKQRQILILQQRLNQQRELNIRHAKESELELEHRLKLQKDDYEATIQRHLTFIDQLIDDKKKLSERCERLVEELKVIDKKSSDRIKSLEEAHRIEIQKLKDVHEAAEKLRRERWIDEKTKKIKELTVRGLEPEIQKLISKHKGELAKMKTVHEAELLAADERAAQRYVRMTEDLRNQLEREKESAIARERESARERYEKAIRDEEKSFGEQRRRLYTEIEDEKNRQAEIAAKQRADLDKLRRDIEENHRTAVDAAKREYEAIRLEQERRHAAEIHELKEKLALEKQSWEENALKRQETYLASKERELREQMRKERDKEIERIIAQFESDTTMTKEEAERTAENRVKRIRDKYEAEFRELEHSERQTKERYNQIKGQMTEIEGENERLQVILKQKESEINDIRKITETLQKERERLADIIRQEFADRLVMTEEENRRIKGDMAELKARQQLELEKKKEEMDNLQRDKEKELEAVHEKIKQAIQKKDEQVQTLKTQYDAAVKRADHLEGLLAQQRKLIAGTTAANGTHHPSSAKKT